MKIAKKLLWFFFFLSTGGGLSVMIVERLEEYFSLPEEIWVYSFLAVPVGVLGMILSLTMIGVIAGARSLLRRYEQSKLKRQMQWWGRGV